LEQVHRGLRLPGGTTRLTVLSGKLGGKHAHDLRYPRTRQLPTINAAA